MSERDATTLKQRDDWMKAILGSPEHATLKLVACRLALYVNIKTGRCDPSYRTLARDVGVSERSAMRATADLEAGSWIKVERTAGGVRAGGQRGNTNKFVLLPPPERVTQVCHPSEPDKGDTALSPLRVTNPTPKGDKNGPGRVTQLCHPNREENREGEQRTREQSALSAPMCTLAREPAIVLKRDEGKQLEVLAKAFQGTDFGAHAKQRAQQAKRQNGHAWPDDYRQQFWNAYPHKVAPQRALAELARLRRKRRNRPGWHELMAAVLAYASSQRIGGDRRWMNPENWLKEERWNDRPATAKY
jgi:hypothetical protein